MAAKKIDEDVAPEKEHHMSFGEHIEDLRGCMIRAVAGVVLICFVTFYYGKEILEWVMWPGRRALEDAGQEPTFFQVGMSEGFGTYLKVSIISAIVLCFPWLVWQLWRFVSAGLYASERRIAYIIAPFSTGMGVLGVLFSYYVMVPVVLTFLIMFSLGFGSEAGSAGLMDQIGVTSAVKATTPGGVDAATLEVEKKEQAEVLVDDRGNRMEIVDVDPKVEGKQDHGRQWINVVEKKLKVVVGNEIWSYAPVGQQAVGFRLSLSEYVSNVLMVTIGIVIGFQLPVVMLILGWVGIVDAVWLGGFRKYALLVCLVVGALLTPSDPISMLILAIPLYVLFELGLVLMKIVPQRDGEGPMGED